MVIPGGKTLARIDYRFSGKQANIVRLEFNPAYLGLDGLKDLHAHLSNIVPDGWRRFSADARISRLDVAVDLPGVRISKLKIVPPKAVVSQTWHNAQGKLETYQWGKPKGSHIQVYNKTAQLKSKGEPVEGPQVTRIERRLKQLGKAPTQLGELPNPFAGLVLTEAIPPAPEGGPAYVWPLFCDSVSVRGLHAALQLLPEHKRAAFKKQFAACKPDWWNPAALWAAWPAYLDNLRIADPKAWT